MNNDSDLNGFDIAVVAHTQPAHGTLVLNADGSYTYTPEPDYYGSDSFTYTITNFNGRADTATVYLTVLPVNDAPGFTGGADQNLTVGAGAQTVPAWATNISKGPANESGQTLTFHVTNNNAALFSVPPAISADGTLTYTPAPNMSGIATVTVYLQDDGGRANGGEDRSAEYTFTINVAGYSIGDFVWEDLNGNGVQDSGEPGLSNVVVRLLDVHGTEVATTLTDVNGMYLFSEQLPGAYVLDVAAPAGYEPTRYQQGDDPALDNDINPLTGLSDLVMLTAGQTNLTADAGFVVPAVVRGYVFRDNNGDMLRNIGDSTLTNVLVCLMVDGYVVASTNTDAVGYYEFSSVMPGVVSVLVSRVDATLVGVPDTHDERRNRAIPDLEGLDAVIVHTVLSGEGVRDGQPAETLNFGFSDYPLSTAIDIRLHATAEGVMIQLWTVNEAGWDDIVIYAWIDNDWVEVGRVPGEFVVGEGANDYTVAANGLAAGGAYYLKVIDEVGNVHLSLTPVAVDALQVDAVKLDLQYVTLRFNTEYGRHYQVEVSTDLVTWRTEYVSAPKANGGWTPFSTEPFMAGPDTHTEVRVPRNGRARAFFKIKCVER